MPIKINGSKKAAEEAAASADILPEGKYVFNIFDLEESEYSESSKNAGRPRLIAKLKVAEGPFKGREVHDYNIPLFTEWSSGATAFTAFQFLRAVGGEVDEDGNLLFPVEEFSDLLGTQIKVSIVHEDDYQDPDIKRARVGRYLAPDTEIEEKPLLVTEPAKKKAESRFTAKKSD